MKQYSRTLQAGYYVLPCQLICETQVKNRERASVIMLFNVWKVPELFCSKQSYLDECENITIPEEQSQANSEELFQWQDL